MARKKVADQAEDPAAAGLDRVEFEPVREDDAETASPALPPNEPPVHDPKWTDYVLKQLTDEEMWNGNPKVAALRRVASRLLGPIIDSTSEVVQAPNAGNGHCATVLASVTFLWTKDLPDDMVPFRRTFTGVADVYPGNAPDANIARFPSATAETRAEGRALRKALHLERVVAAEEMTTLAVEESGLDGKITPTQKNFIDMKCGQVNVDVLKFIGRSKAKYQSLEEVPYAKAQEMIQYLSELQQKPENIPDNIKGYKANWSDKR